MAAFRSPFTATRVQVATYLLCVALFSISFLVFLNSSISFLITNLIGQKHDIGNAVGTLGFADEIVALIACPTWGWVSDKLGVRFVCVCGYTLVGLSLFIFVQTRNVYPQLLLARLLFSVGGAATATMVTAVLPAMTRETDVDNTVSATPPLDAGNGTTTHTEPNSQPAGPTNPVTNDSSSNTSIVAGLVGAFTGLGALVALFIFLPLPASFQSHGSSPAAALTKSFYIVGAIALVVALLCAVGLHNLAGEQNKGWTRLTRRFSRNGPQTPTLEQQQERVKNLLWDALTLGFTDANIALGYIGGFVARASSVAISLFIPLFVNAYFINSGRCSSTAPSDPSDIKSHCREAYILAAALTGASQTFALVFAPIFGFLDARFARHANAPLVVAAACGVAGYAALANVRNPDFKDKAGGGGGGVFVVMALVGISQIGAIVCSLSMLGRGIQGMTTVTPAVAQEISAPVAEESEGPSWTDLPDPVYGAWQGVSDGNTNITGPTGSTEEGAPLLPSAVGKSTSREHLKGSIAGVYSFGGGVGILLLTKAGGALFDSWTVGAPFYMMAIFNALLLVSALGIFILRGRLHKGKGMWIRQ